MSLVAGITGIHHHTPRPAPQIVFVIDYLDNFEVYWSGICRMSSIGVCCVFSYNQSVFIDFREEDHRCKVSLFLFILGCPPKTHVLKACSPRLYLSEGGHFSGEWIMNALISRIN
jgi:hypothetical protein